MTNIFLISILVLIGVWGNVICRRLDAILDELKKMNGKK